MHADTLAGLGVRRWGEPSGTAPVVLALHGLTGTAAAWTDVAGRLDLPVVAPDLPGRGASVDTQAGPGLPGLAGAVVRLVDDLALRRVVVVGHSMGAFLAPLVVEALGERAVGVVLVDGGVPPARSPLHRPLVVRTLFGIQLRRLVRDWATVDDYSAVAEGRAAAGRPDLRDGLREWSADLLRPHGGALRPALDPGRVVADAVDSLCRAPHLPLLRHSGAAVHLVAAAHGADDTRGPFLSDEAVAAATRVVPQLTWERVPANHATMLFDPAVAAAVTSVAARGRGSSG